MVPLPPSSGMLLRWTIFCPEWMHLPAEKSIYSASNCPQSAPLFFNVEINLRCGAVFDDLLAVQFHFQFRHSRPFHASNRFCSFCHCVFRSLREALFRCSHYINDFLRHLRVSLILIPQSGLYRSAASLGLSRRFVSERIVCGIDLQRDLLKDRQVQEQQKRQPAENTSSGMEHAPACE